MANGMDRRDFFKTAGVAAAAAAAAVPVAVLPGAAGAQAVAPPPMMAAGGATGPAGAEPTGVLYFFREEEARLVEAMVERLIPTDPEWPGAAWAGVMNFIDRQLAGAYGEGARMYLEGPWKEGTPQQGYQLRFTPAQLYRAALGDIAAHVRGDHGGKRFWELDATAQDEFLKGLESGKVELPSLPSPVFFETLLANAIEGWFADPIHGGNRDMVSWRMVGFPGAFAQYVDLVEAYDVPFTRPPIGIADHVRVSGHGSEHVPAEMRENRRGMSEGHVPAGGSN